MIFKDLQNKLHDIQQGFEYLLPAGCVQITDEEAQAMIDAETPQQATKTTLELDTDKYLRRANSKNLLMAEMAAMNVARIKDGTWTVAQLTALMQDEQIKALIAHMETLSFELAIGVIQGLTNPLITPEIKSAWTARLVAKL